MSGFTFTTSYRGNDGTEINFAMPIPTDEDKGCPDNWKTNPASTALSASLAAALTDVAAAGALRSASSCVEDMMFVSSGDGGEVARARKVCCWPDDADDHSVGAGAALPSFVH